MAKPQHWLIKSEPEEYSYTQLTKDRRAEWTGIRNFQARNNLRAMKVGDLALYYHTGDEKQVVGVARVASEPKPDPTAPGEDWSCVDVEPHAALKRPVTLAQLRATAALKDFPILKQGRLSVAPVTPAQFAAILKLGGTKLAK
jgi:predicted RNA-binding protein with PUA-like domain